MLARIMGRGQSVMIDVNAEVTWGSAAAREYGSVSFTLQRGSPAWSHDVIDENGGFMVIIESPVGRMRAIADRPIHSALGMTFKALPLEHWLSERVVGHRQDFRSALSGHVFTAGFRDALDGALPIKLGSVLMSAPLVSEVKFQGQPFMDVIHQLMDETGFEWWLDDDLRLHWGPFQGRFRERWIVDDGTVFRRLQLGSILDIESEIIEVEPDGGTFVARDETAPLLWPSQKTVRL